MADQTLPTTMKALQYSSVAGGMENNLKINPKTPMPKKYNSLPKDSALVKVAYTTLNPFDYKMPEAPILGSLAVSKPAIPCEDFSGTVVASTIAHLKPGQLVFGFSPPPKFGTLAEYVLVTGADFVVPLPSGVSLHDISAVGVTAGTAYQTIIPFAKPGAKVFLNGGSGGVGTFAIQIAKAHGCYVAVSCSSANVELCRSLGADEVIDYRVTDVVTALKRAGTQYDLVVDYVGTPAIYWSAQDYLKPEGVFVTIALSLTLRGIREMAAVLFLPRWLGGGQRRSQWASLVPKKAEYEQIAKWMAEGKVRTVVDETIDMDQAAEGFAKVKMGRTKGKVIVRVAGG